MITKAAMMRFSLHLVLHETSSAMNDAPLKLICLHGDGLHALSLQEATDRNVLTSTSLCTNVFNFLISASGPSKNNAAWTLFCLWWVKKTLLESKKTPQTHWPTHLDSPWPRSYKQPHILPKISQRKRCKKNNTKNNPYCTVHVFIVAHFNHRLSATLSDLDCSFQQSFRKAKESQNP